VCRDKPAQWEGVQVSDSEGLAHHAGPESCASLGNEDREAVTGARAGRVESPAIGRVLGADALQALRGVPCTVAVTTVAARGDLTRFDNPRPLRHSLGLTRSAYSTGERRPQGGITKTGHSPARRALGAGAWASHSPATSRRHLQ
jgi:transposase